LEEEHCFELVNFVLEGHSPFETDLFFTPHYTCHLSYGIVKADLLIFSCEAYDILPCVLHLHVVSLETQREVIAASELKSFVRRLQEELTYRRMV
jgi:hypothetical protein